MYNIVNCLTVKRLDTLHIVCSMATIGISGRTKHICYCKLLEVVCVFTHGWSKDCYGCFGLNEWWMSYHVVNLIKCIQASISWLCSIDLSLHDEVYFTSFRHIIMEHAFSHAADHNMVFNNIAYGRYINIEIDLGIMA